MERRRKSRRVDCGKLQPEGKKTLMLEGIGIGNTLAWDEGHRQALFGDS